MTNISFEGAVLALLLDGAETPDEIASILRVDVEEVERALRNLELEGLVKTEEKGFWIFKKKIYKLTAKGYEEAVKAKEKLVKLAGKVKELLEKARRAETSRDVIVGELEPYIPFLPLLLYFNLLDVMLLLPLMELPLIAGLLEDYDVEGEDIEDTDIGDIDIG